VRCRVCGEPAGWWRRWCEDCRKLWDRWSEFRNLGMFQVLGVLRSSGVSEEKLVRFLRYEPRSGSGSVQDQMAADLSNDLLAAFGNRARSIDEVRELRRRGVWRGYDQCPEDPLKRL
jgi:hypothetical protein